ncbi:uncharacterized protein LOC133902987 [Phragmites australis]|uniref:uncharacterized protein LOC133902987 n=1 Tax=Phragmites australis TaxID=29695 RepID=UPI002D78BCD8|nr:uncharacterized protein LOC133902987 [Phragmites australis]
MSSLLRSFASLYCQKLRSTTRLGPSCNNVAARFPASDGRMFLASGEQHRGVREYRVTGGAADDTRRPAALALPCHHGQERTPFLTWVRIAIGSVLAAATPFLHSKWVAFLRIQSELEVVKDTAEVVAEVVEEAAVAAEKVSSEVAEQLPEGGKLRTAAVLVEHASKEVAEEAHLAQDIIHKVNEIEEGVKAMIEPFVDLGKHGQGKEQHKLRGK